MQEEGPLGVSRSNVMGRERMSDQGPPLCIHQNLQVPRLDEEKYDIKCYNSKYN